MEFAAGISHELRTPLAVIQSAAHNLRAGLVRDPEGVEEYAAIVQKEARRLSDMVEQVMTYTQAQSGRKRYEIGVVDVNDVIDRALQNLDPMLQDSGAVIQRQVEPNVKPAMADAAALTQCLQNLLSNAVKYGRRDGALYIEIACRQDPQSSKIHLSVVDHGMGVPAEDVQHLFEPFHRGSNASANTPGNGLGLHLVQKMMEAQSGSVTYKPRSSGGSIFTLVIPVADMSL
jgi:signal transduction histidine kinase